MELETYPAVDDGPLCKLLDDPAYWAVIFSDAEDRKAAKRAVKRLPHRGGLGNVIKIERDEVIGQAIHTLLRTARGRELLDAELHGRLDEYESDPRNMIAQVLYQHFAERQEWFEPLEAQLVEEEETELRFLTAEGLASYLEAEGRPEEPEHQKWLAGIVCAFALVSRRERVKLLEALVALGPPFEEMLGLPA